MIMLIYVCYTSDTIKHDHLQLTLTLCYLTILHVTGRKNIFDYWKEHFHKLLNCNNNDADLQYNVIGKLENIQYDANMIAPSEDICKLIENHLVRMALAQNHSGLPMIDCMYCWFYVFQLASHIDFYHCP